MVASAAMSYLGQLRVKEAVRTSPDCGRGSDQSGISQTAPPASTADGIFFFNFSMKEKSMASVKVFKAYAIETGIAEEEWDKGFNKSVDKHYGSKYDEAKTEDCHKFLEQIIPDGKERVNKVVQTLY